MGSGIAEVVVKSGFRAAVLEATPELCERGLANISRSLDRQVAKGTLKPEDKQALLERVEISTKAENFADCDLVVEAIVENIETKKKLWQSLNPVLKRDCILASNTSSLSITDMMMTTAHPERFVGIHFFNPVPQMQLVEVSRSLLTVPEVYQTALDWVGSLGKTAVQVSDRPGFIVNRLLIPYLVDAVRLLENGTGTITHIDQAMKLGCGYPMGPFVLIDLIGIDTTVSIAEILYEEFAEPRFAPPGLLRHMVKCGWLGRKSGRGFYDYSDRNSPKPMDDVLTS